MSESACNAINQFFAKPVCLKAAKPLKKSALIRLRLDDGTELLAKKQGDALVAEPGEGKPDLTFDVSKGAYKKLVKNDIDDIGELAVFFLKLIVNSDPNKKITPAIHIGTFDFLRKGYIGLFTVGGAPLMKQLAVRGLGNIGKIKTTLSNLRTEA